MSKLILGIDTISSELEVCLIHENEIIRKISWEKNNNESEKVLRNIKSLFTETDFQLADLDLIVVTIGPGSYTGTRIGVSVANALAYSLKKQLIGVPTSSFEELKFSKYILDTDLSKIEKFRMIEPVYAKEPTITIKKLKK